MGRPPGLCLLSLQLDPSGSVQGPPIPGSGAYSGCPLLGSTPLVSGPAGASGGGPLLPSKEEGSTQTTSLPPLPPEPPRASADCVSFIERSAHHFGFSKAVACQLTHCRHRSTRVNYQAKWAVFRSWCHRNGHSVSQPTAAKVADFLLYLRRSLSLSYSSIASFRSMLNSVFHFVLPELSSHFVLHDLLLSFRLERPLSSSRVPPWDLLSVLHFLRGAPFEPLSSCSLRDLTRKVLFLVALATARRVGKLQAVSCAISMSGEDVFLSYLPEFRAKTESASKPLPRSFCVCSLRDFVGDLPEELLLCPVCALRIYFSRTSSFKNTKNLFIHIALIPEGDNPRVNPNILKCLLHSPVAKGYRLVVIASRAMVCKTPTYYLILNSLAFARGCVILRSHILFPLLLILLISHHI